MSAPAVSTWRLSPARAMTLDRPRVLAILNLTPDSFSDGGELSGPDSALAAAERALSEGADGLDIGGESTRPGAARVSAHDQIARVVPAIATIRKQLGDALAITIDTTLAEVARAAFDAGADAANDVSAGTEAPAMFEVCARFSRGIVLMHRLVAPGSDVFSHQYAKTPEYPGGVVASAKTFLRDRAAAAIAAGIPRDGILLDPGLGFGKSVEQNLELIAQTHEFVSLGFGVLSGVSRKSFTAKAAGFDMNLPPRERVHASVGLSIVHFQAGARVFRVHDVREHVEALRAVARWHGSDRPNRPFGRRHRSRRSDPW